MTGKCLSIVLALAAQTHASPLAWWRFEDHSAQDKLDARMGTDEAPLTFSKNQVGLGDLRTYNTRPEVFPPDTSPTFISPRDLPPKVSGMKNERCVRFFGNQDFYSAKQNGIASPLESIPLGKFTIEGLFKLTLSAADNKNNFQVIIGKDGKPSAALPNQPFVVVIAGQTDFRVTADCLSVHIIDRKGNYRTAASHTKLDVDHWYAFATVSDGKTLKLFINRFDGGGYKQEGETPIDEGVIASTGQWTVGRGMYEGSPNSWLQGCADEIRIDDDALPPNKWLMAGVGQLPERAPEPVSKVAAMPIKCVADLADPDVLLHDGTYYMYGTTGETTTFGVWSSRDLRTWTKGPTLLQAGPGVWGDQDFWAPGIIERGGKFYFYYSTSGILPYAGGPRSARINVAVSDAPTGPFKEVAARLPLIGRAAIDPQPFIDDDGKAYLYFVGDVSEGSGQIYVAQLGDDMTGIVGEPLKILEHSQPWEGPTWNEGPYVIKDGDTYILTYSGNFWASPDYAVGFATSKSPLGPWKKYEENPILHRYAGLNGTGHNAIVRAPDGGWLMFFHAHRSADDKARDTYFARLNITRDKRNDVILSVSPWEAK